MSDQPSEAAMRVAQKIVEQHLYSADDYSKLAANIARAIDDEGERCAKIAEELSDEIGQDIAAAIRSAPPQNKKAG